MFLGCVNTKAGKGNEIRYIEIEHQKERLLFPGSRCSNTMAALQWLSVKAKSYIDSRIFFVLFLLADYPFL